MGGCGLGSGGGHRRGRRRCDVRRHARALAAAACACACALVAGCELSGAATADAEGACDCSASEARASEAESALEVERIVVDSLNRRFEEALVGKEVELKRSLREASEAAAALAGAEERARTAEAAALKAARMRDESARAHRAAGEAGEADRVAVDALRARVAELEGDLAEGGLERALERAAAAEARAASSGAQLRVAEQSCERAAEEAAAELRRERESAAVAAETAADEVDRLRRQAVDLAAVTTRLEADVAREQRTADAQRVRADALQRDAERGAAAAGRATTAEAEAASALAREARALASRDKCLTELENVRREANERVASLADMRAKLRASESTVSEEAARARRSADDLKHRLNEAQGAAQSASTERDRWAERAEAAEASASRAQAELARAREDGERAARREFRRDQIAIQTEVNAARKEAERLRASCGGGGGASVGAVDEGGADTGGMPAEVPSAEELARASEAAAESETVLALLQKISILEEGCDADSAGAASSASTLQGDAQMRRRLSRVEAEYERQRRTLEDREQRLASVKEARDVWRTKAQDAAAELATRTEELTRAAKDRSDVKRRMAAEEAAQDAQAQLAVVEAERDMASDEVQRLRASLNEAIAAGEGSDCASGGLNGSRATNLEAELDEARAALAQARRDAVEANGKAAGASCPALSGSSASSELRAELEREQERRLLAEAALQRSETSSMGTAAALDDSKAEIERLRTQVLELRDANEDAAPAPAAATASAETRPPAGTTECAQATSEEDIAGMREDLSHARAQLEELRVAVYVADSERDKWSAEAMHLQREVENLRAFAASKGGLPGGGGGPEKYAEGGQAFNLRGYSQEY